MKLDVTNITNQHFFQRLILKTLEFFGHLIHSINQPLSRVYIFILGTIYFIL